MRGGDLFRGLPGRAGRKMARIPHGVLFAAASGGAIGATFSPHGGALLPFLAFAPLGAALAPGGPARSGYRVRRRSASAPFALGFTAAAIAHGAGLYWMIPALAWRTALALPAYLAVVGLAGMLAGAACEGAALLHRRWRLPLPVALAACWTGSEWAAAHIPGFSHAWLSAGMSLGWSPALAAGSELAGARFLTFWTVAVGVWIGMLPRMTRRTVPAMVLALLPAVLGQARQWTLAGDEPVARVAAVQPGRAGGELGDWLEPLRRAGSRESFDVAAFPERFLASSPRPPTPGAPGSGSSLASFAGALGVPVLTGAMDAEAPDAGGGADASSSDTLRYNAAFLQMPGGGLSSPYRKVRLVPGLEGRGWWPRFAPAFGATGYTAGRAVRPLTGDGLRIGVLVCYDSAFAETARTLARRGAQWLATLSNDDWLDPAGEFRVTWAYWQHATHGRLRAIENRISVLQVASTGYTFSVPPSGVSAPFALEPGTAGAVVLEAHRRGAATPFTRTGDLLGPACLLVLMASLVAGRFR